jgi:hypothetical protein
MGERCPMTVFSGGSVSTRAGENACWIAEVVEFVGAGEVAVDAIKFGMGMLGAPEQEARIKLTSRKQFKVSRKRRFIIHPLRKRIVCCHYNFTFVIARKALA